MISSNIYDIYYHETYVNIYKNKKIDTHLQFYPKNKENKTGHTIFYKKRYVNGKLLLHIKHSICLDYRRVIFNDNYTIIEKRHHTQPFLHGMCFVIENCNLLDEQNNMRKKLNKKYIKL